MGESVSVEAIKGFERPIYDKDEKTRDKLRMLLGYMKELLGQTEDTDLQKIIDAFYPVTATLGQDVVRQNEQGERLYILFEGELDVFIRTQESMDTKGSKVDTLRPHAMFGDMALLHSTPNSSTVTVASDVAKFQVIDGKVFKLLTNQAMHQHYEQVEGWLAQVELLKPLDRSQRVRLCDAVNIRHYEVGETVIKQGDRGDAFYILKSGTCTAFVSGSKGMMEAKRYELQGEYFGELALLRDEPRNATVRATGKTGATVAAISRQDFENMVGSLRDELDKHSAKYAPYGCSMRSAREEYEETEI